LSTSVDVAITTRKPFREEVEKFELHCRQQTKYELESLPSKHGKILKKLEIGRPTLFAVYAKSRGCPKKKIQKKNIPELYRSF